MTVEVAPDSAFQQAVYALGGQSAMSRLITRAQQTISDRLRSGKPLWAEDVLTVEAATGIPRWQLRPDLYPREEPAALDHRPAHDGPSNLEPVR